MQKIIDPKEVPRMFKEGKLWHGIKLQFRLDTSGEWTKPSRLLGFDPDAAKADRKCFWSCSYAWQEQARFPLPELKTDDPVIVWMSKKVEHKRYFKEFNCDGDIICFNDGATSWSAITGVRWNGWRLPRQDELP